MKKIIVLLGVLISCCLFSKAQDGKITVDQATYDDMRDKIRDLNDSIAKLQKQCKPLAKLEKENDKLTKDKNKLESLNKILKNDNKDLNDSIAKLQKQCKPLAKLEKENNKLTKDKNKLDSLNKELKKVNKELKSQIDKLTGKKGIIEQKNDSITRLTNDIMSLRQEKEQDRANCEKKLEIEKEKAIEAGRAEIRKKTEEYYEQDFEKLIASTSLEIVTRDSAIVKSAKSKDNISKLHQYFLIKESLTLPYNEEFNKVAQNQLSSLQKTPSVEELKRTLDGYSICVEELQNSMAKIIDLDKKSQVNDRYGSPQRQGKKEKISGYLTEYIVEYEAVNYPYLLNIVLEIMQRKQDNVDAPIEDLYERLSGHEFKRDK